MPDPVPAALAPAAPRPQRAWLAYLMLTLTMLFWSGNFIVGRGLRDILSPVSLSFWRWLLTAILILPFAWPHLRRQWPIIVHNWRLLTLLSMLMVSLGNTLSYFALESTTAINASLVNATQPIGILVIAWLIDRETVTRLQGLGIVLSLIGVLLVISRADIDAILSLRLNIGDFWMFLAVISFSIYAVIHRRAPRDLHPLVMMQTLALIGAICTIPAYVAEWAAGTSRLAMQWDSVFALVYVSLCASFIAILFWNLGLAEIGPNRAGVFIYLLPVFSSILSVTILDEPVGLYHLAGFAFIIVGIYVTTQLGVRRRNER